VPERLPAPLYRPANRVREGWGVERAGVRVLLGNLPPVMAIGLARILTEDGAEVIGDERHPSALVTAAERLRPEVVVLDAGAEGAQQLAARVQRVSPATKVILCGSGEDSLDVLDPGAADGLRRVDIDASEGLRLELAATQEAPWAGG